MFERSVTVMLTVFLASSVGVAEYQPTPHRPLAPGAIAVTASGNLDQPGATYQLMNDVTSDRTALFLAKDVTLDLNGYTVTYAKGPYAHVPNGDFEKDFEGFDTTKAPKAEIRDAGGDWPFVGKKICRLPKGEEIVSAYVTLPVANRSYYAMVGMLSDTAPVTISVEDEAGKPVTYEHHVGEKTYKTCPISASSKLDGGCVYAHFRGVPAGRYRVRVKAGDEDLFIDQVDIRPALDVGIAIVGDGWVYTQYSQVAWGGHLPVVRDYLVEGSYNRLLPTVTSAKGNTKVVIRNGIIRNGFRGIHTWGIISKGAGGTVELENVKMISQGVNTNQVFLWDNRGIIRNCRFETDTEFIIERHNIKNCPVGLAKVDGSEVSHCEFIGGQGNLYIHGKGGKVHDNLFVNRQRVVNHYAIGLAQAEEIEICNNRFEADIGNGITVYVSRNNDIHHNTFKMNARDWSCTVYKGPATITGVRITDYNSKKGRVDGCYGNKVRDNKFIVTGRQFTTHKADNTYQGRAMGRSCAVFYSSGAGKNYITNNEITVNHADPDSDAMTCAFYVGAANYGGTFEGNRITSNVPVFWIAAGYGPAGGLVIKDNTFIKGPNPATDYQPIRMGWWVLVANDVEFRSNTCVGSDFGIQWGNTSTKKDEHHSYSVYWTLTVKGPAGADVVIVDKDGNEALQAKIGPEGVMTAELLEYSAVVTKTGPEYTFNKTYAAPYTVRIGAWERTIALDRNTEVTR